MTTDGITQLEKEAAAHNGKCSNCHQNIKIYRYKINRNHAVFLKAMANEINNSRVNDVDISTIGLAYSVRSQVTKMRQHGLIARVKNAEGSQIARRWLITHKGYDFLKGSPIASKVVVYNNAVLGHEGYQVTIYEVLGEKFNPNDSVYNETPVSEPEARMLNEVRQPKKKLEYTAVWRGHNYGPLKPESTYTLLLERMQMGKPVSVEVPSSGYWVDYKDIAAFTKDWRVT